MYAIGVLLRKPKIMGTPRGGEYVHVEQHAGQREAGPLEG
jgi:hypothetical protein